MFLLILALALASANASCITFSIASGTSCSWMCTYCGYSLNTNYYYFTDSVCTYSAGTCAGSPVPGKNYTCCSVEAIDNSWNEF